MPMVQQAAELEQVDVLEAADGMIELIEKGFSDCWCARMGNMSWSKRRGKVCSASEICGGAMPCRYRLEGKLAPGRAYELER